eukprot:GHVU01073442.1.p1 GENE.GHVU01073442.1~~GHVU01073442.1.p1  ORF type:complete len:172 (-),score=53.52 GHVU01073442.1:862-1377(-)
MGYGSEAMRQLMDHFDGGGEAAAAAPLPRTLRTVAAEDTPAPRGEEDTSADEDNADDNEPDEEEEGEEEEEEEEAGDSDDEKDAEKGEKPSNKKPKKNSSKLLSEEIAVEEAPTLLEPADTVAASCRPDYIGSSFGLTKELYNFWRRLGFRCVYLRQSSQGVRSSLHDLSI